MHQHNAACAHGPSEGGAAGFAQPAGHGHPVAHGSPVGPAQPGGHQPAGHQPAGYQMTGAHAGPAGYAQPAGQVTYVQPPPPDSRLYRFVMTLWTRPAWLAPLAILGCVAAAFGYVLTNDPTDNVRDPLGPCAFKAMTGWDCPGCGGTRMVWYLLHADLPQAFRHHMIALVAVPVVAYLFVRWAATRVSGFSLPALRIPRTVWGSYLAVWVVFSVLRNLPWEPFSYFYVT